MPRSLESLLSRDRLIIALGVFGTTALAWAYMVREAQAMSLTGICCCVGMKMSGPDLGPWSASTLVPLFLMWSEMMVAMMLPSAAPMILTFAAVNRKRREREQPFVPAGIFVLGYFVVWTGFSLIAAAGQWILHGNALLSSSMASTSHSLAGALLVGAGLFQWTPLKHSCLRHCRSPLTFLLTDWRDGRRGAFVMGLKHGLYCTGCCWILMALLFVAGVMNVWWLIALTILVLIEKLAPKGIWIARTIGVSLVAWGAGVFFLA